MAPGRRPVRHRWKQHRDRRLSPRSRGIAVAVLGPLLLVTLSFMIVSWWIGKVVIAVVAALVFFWVRSRRKPPPPGRDGVPHEGEPPATAAPPGESGRAS